MSEHRKKLNTRVQKILNIRAQEKLKTRVQKKAESWTLLFQKR